MSTGLDASWHKRHPMPKRLTVQERIPSHLELQKGVRLPADPTKSARSGSAL